ncbi:MAG: hypothetical protein LKH33_08440 [Acetobacter sp.]|jgi:hypothetical protein|nr:hypothetical protein [Acetobacter sp.]MCI1485822.1 hypothetical protein [Acetobacter sp.]MCI1529796.1 hypothetical protein [Acetobacter sp.]MCI1587535.1 hypothetical protein [Acetobacter sp.]MCI1601752.1 hypothetical protein [Acetobacter sp.]
MIISVPSGTRSFSIRREGEQTIIVIDQDEPSDVSDGTRPLQSEKQVTRRKRIPMIAIVCVLIIGGTIGHLLWSPVKSSPSQPSETLTQRSILAGSQGAPMPNKAFGLD